MEKDGGKFIAVDFVSALLWNVKVMMIMMMMMTSRRQMLFKLCNG
jgi:hypothetical protein